MNPVANMSRAPAAAPRTAHLTTFRLNASEVFHPRLSNSRQHDAQTASSTAAEIHQPAVRVRMNSSMHIARAKIHQPDRPSRYSTKM